MYTTTYKGRGYLRLYIDNDLLMSFKFVKISYHFGQGITPFISLIGSCGDYHHININNEHLIITIDFLNNRKKG